MRPWQFLFLVWLMAWHLAGKSASKSFPQNHLNYQWDGENRLVAMTMTNVAGIASSNRLHQQFAYDYLGRRISKAVFNWNGSGFGPNPVRQTTFVYDGWNLVTELKPNNSLLRSYVWGSDLSGSMQGAGGVGGLLIQNVNGTNCFPAYDGNGNVMALVNAADGTVAANYDYAAFGEPIRITGAMAQNNPFRFSTKYADDETDLLYYGYRYYKPSTGTWLNRDPLGDNSFVSLYLSVNPDFDDDKYQQIIGESVSPLYAFVHNNPVGVIDYIGLATDCDIVIYVGHNTTVPQGTIQVGRCSAAAVISCGSFGKSNPGVPTIQIPGTSPIPPFTHIGLIQAANMALNDFALGVAYAKKKCSGGCKCLCKSITVRVECDFGLDIFARLSMPAGVCGKSQTIQCGQ